MSKHTTRLAKCKTRLLLNQPFWGSLALPLTWEVADNIDGHPVDTAAVTTSKAVFNPDFMDTLTDKEMEFLLAHEVGHCMFDHMSRLKGRNGEVWNQAADYHLNYILVESKIGAMPKVGLYNADYVKKFPTTEQLYTHLLQEQQQEQQEQGKGGKSKPQQGKGNLDQMVESDGDEAQQRKDRDTWRQRVAAAATAAKIAGSDLGSLRGVIDQILNPKVPWADVLRDFIVRVRSDERSYARPNRRYPSGINGLLMPTTSGEAIGEIAIAVDCSGSVTEKALQEFATEITAITNDLLPAKTHVVYFDSVVSHHDEYDRYEDPEITMHGGGGTAFSPVFRFLDDQSISPDVVVFLTDLYCSDYGNEPDYPVIWVSTERDYRKPPFGSVVVME